MDIPRGVLKRLVYGFDPKAKAPVEEILEECYCEGCHEKLIYDLWEGDFYKKGADGEYTKIELYMNEEISEYGLGEFCSADCWYEYDHRREMKDFGRW
jgi:hypothetical protein